jgi:nucleotidyltransferase substrate binding protein (TIGR01987 family)
MENKPRWVYRFDNYKRAFFLLREAIEIKHSRPLTQLEKEGVIQRFEYTWELAWKVLKDYLESTGIVLTTITPTSTLKAAIAAGIIQHHDVWMDALDARNKMSHTYNLQLFEAVIENIDQHFLGIFEALYLTLFAHVCEQ